MKYDRFAVSQIAQNYVPWFNNHTEAGLRLWQSNVHVINTQIQLLFFFRNVSMKWDCAKLVLKSNWNTGSLKYFLPVIKFPAKWRHCVCSQPRWRPKTKIPAEKPVGQVCRPAGCLYYFLIFLPRHGWLFWSHNTRTPRAKPVDLGMGE